MTPVPSQVGLSVSLFGLQALGVGVNSWALQGGPEAPLPRQRDGAEALGFAVDCESLLRYFSWERFSLPCAYSWLQGLGSLVGWRAFGYELRLEA